MSNIAKTPEQIIEEAKAQLQEIFQAEVTLTFRLVKPPLTEAVIRQAIVAVTDLPWERIIGRRQDAPIVFARQLYFFYLATELNYSQKFIGRAFDRNHTTIGSSVKKIKGFIKINDSHTLQKIQEIKDIIYP